eukprot:SAG11_NODE_21150_length_431_cov_0.768072_1_plen_22_part_10
MRVRVGGGRHGSGFAIQLTVEA